ncbi:Putative GNAT domain, acyl-CoA N-acyltransferase [Septoria linicola]|uniref:GNAT domain, acyl-CoA N-acyltransferase n=1 Tax=Septoria linicola TaxID=215465 RepID=A0A9Q9ENF4_9PEZI|nr:Putative GNAT domain, acyl-CoA N-acyltransferase [Septoria linicola]
MANIRIEISQEEDIQRLMELVLPTFQQLEYCKLAGLTPENAKAAVERHLEAWREQTRFSNVPMGIKCVHTDPASGQETIISSAEWEFYERERTEAEYVKGPYLVSASWVEDAGTKRRALENVAPLLEKRIRWFAGRPHAALAFMVTDTAFRGQGAAAMCVQWGLDQCKKLGIPAVLEASDAGAPLYKKLGFVEVDRVPTLTKTPVPRTMPVMIWWPPGTKEEDKKPAMPDYALRR